jgi:UDP-N-acetylglucosamine:LPS N-acetylglucosamine transferase
VHVVREYPLSRYFHAFDVAISASGYNSFHELLRFGVPTLFVPNRSTAMDDQVARASFAAKKGFARTVQTVAGGNAPKLIAELLESDQTFIAAVADRDPGNGAADAANHIRAIAGTSPQA